MSEAPPWRDAYNCYVAYHVHEKTTREIGADWGCSHRTILNWLERHGIEKRPARRLGVGPDVSYYTTKAGYVHIADRHNGDIDVVKEHQLVALAMGADPYKLFSGRSGYAAHHDNGIRWDNRPENIEVMSMSDHMKHHWERGDGPAALYE